MSNRSKSEDKENISISENLENQENAVVADQEISAEEQNTALDEAEQPETPQAETKQSETEQAAQEENQPKAESTKQAKAPKASKSPAKQQTAKPEDKTEDKAEAEDVKVQQNTAQAKAITAVIVALNSPRGLVLTTSKGKKIRLNGSPVTKILDQDGKPCRGRFGLTEVKADDWEDLKKTYANSAWFTADPPQIFAHSQMESVLDEAEDKKAIAHGFEQVKLESTRTQQLKEE